MVCKGVFRLMARTAIILESLLSIGSKNKASPKAATWLFSGLSTGYSMLGYTPRSKGICSVEQDRNTVKEEILKRRSISRGP